MNMISIVMINVLLEAILPKIIYISVRIIFLNVLQNILSLSLMIKVVKKIVIVTNFLITYVQ